jgi:hypothetical protein
MERVKIDSWPTAIVTVAGLACGTVAVLFLFKSGASLEAIGAFAVIVVGMFAGQIVQARKASTVEAKTDQQTEMIERVVRQTNGLSAAERQDIAERAAVAMVDKLRPRQDPFIGGDR